MQTVNWLISHYLIWPCALMFGLCGAVLVRWAFSERRTLWFALVASTITILVWSYPQFPPESHAPFWVGIGIAFFLPLLFEGIVSLKHVSVNMAFEELDNLQARHQTGQLPLKEYSRARAEVLRRYRI